MASNCLLIPEKCALSSVQRAGEAVGEIRQPSALTFLVEGGRDPRGTGQGE